MMRNARLEMMLAVAVKSGLRGGRYVLDCYMGRTIRSEWIHTITCRTATDNNTFVMEVYEEDNSPERDRRRLCIHDSHQI